MKVFKITPSISVECEWKKTRNGFKHTATLVVNGRRKETVKVNYLNRTWESYEFQAVLQRLIEKSKVLTAEEKTVCNAFAEKDQSDNSNFNAIAMVAKMGEIFADTDEQKNDWKKRMLLAGLGNQGLSFPDDWATLSEEEKKRRLDGAIASITKK